MTRCSLVIIATSLMLTLGPGEVGFANTTDSTVYGSGPYGSCDYGACGITLTSSGATSINVVPSASGACTVQSDSVSVLTDSPTGYSVTMTTSTAQNAMVNGSNTVGASSGTASLPATLANNTWGYRIDGLSSFGAGPTTALSSGSAPSLKFAGMPASGQSPANVATSASLANPTVTTKVWYGTCMNTSLPAGNYTTTITYTAVTT